MRRKVISDKLKISRFTTSVTFIHISAHFQEGRQTGQPLWLLAGKIQRTALVDLPSSIRIMNKTEERLPDVDTKVWVTVNSPGLASRCRLRVPAAVSPCPACSSARRCEEDCSTTPGLESTNKCAHWVTTYLKWILIKFPPTKVAQKCLHLPRCLMLHTSNC